MSEMMINFFHPCYEVDVWETNTPEEFVIALGQGYLRLKDVRQLILDNAEALEDKKNLYKASLELAG